MESISDFHAYFFIFYNKTFPQEVLFLIFMILLSFAIILLNGTPYTSKGYLCDADSQLKYFSFKSEPTSNCYDYIGERSKAFRKAGKFMAHDEIIQYYDYLMRLAASKCNSQTDAEDLVGDTMLAALN